MTDFAMNFALTNITSSGPKDGSGTFKQLKFTWYTMPWNRLTVLPPCLTQCQDTLHFYVNDPNRDLNTPLLTLTFFGPRQNPLATPLNQEVCGQAGVWCKWGPSNSQAGWFWPGPQETYKVIGLGLEIEMTSLLQVGDQQWFVDPEMNVEGPTGPDPDLHSPPGEP